MTNIKWYHLSNFGLFAKRDRLQNWIFKKLHYAIIIIQLVKTVFKSTK